jgi:hypothetical protein
MQEPSNIILSPEDQEEIANAMQDLLFVAQSVFHLQGNVAVLPYMQKAEAVQAKHSFLLSGLSSKKD